ncbi:MAG: outer membrane beta-barrel protein [Flavobacteriales bacterium]
MMRISFLLAFFIAGIAVNGQRKFTGGLLVGPLFSQISGDGLGGWDKLGVGGGGWVGVPISDKNTISMSMKYVTKGSRSKRDTLDFNSFAFHLNYIDVPILFEREFRLGNSRMSWSIGPYIGILLSQKAKVNGVDYGVSEASQGAPFEPLDIGAMGALTGWVGERIFIQYSLSTSLLPTRPAPLVVNQNSYYEQGNYNQTMQLMFGLRFGKTD